MIATGNAILQPHEHIDAARAGGKAAGLARLGAAGFRVPRWFCIAADVSDADLERARDKITRMTAALGVRQFAVRSSAAQEDGCTHSFAGQLESYLNVPAACVFERIVCVRRSAFSERVTAYRRSRGLQASSSAAVIVQEMIEPMFAGVAFSRDPLSGERVAVISAVAGVGEALVSGEQTGDTIRIGPSGEVLGREGEEILTIADALSIAQLTRAIEGALGIPQDVEWAIDASGPYILQARPITTLGQPRTIWDNSNIAESYGGVNSTLTFSFARYAYSRAYRRMLEVLRVPPAALQSNADALEDLLGLVHGRMYYNLVNWYRLLALLPGFRFNRPFMERMMGVEDSLPPEVMTSLLSGRNERIADFVAMVRMASAIVLEHCRLPRKIRAFHRWFDETLDHGIDLTMASDDQLVAEFRAIEDRLSHRWDTPLINDFLTMIFFGVLGALCKRWCGDTDGSLQNDVLATCGGMISAEPAARILEMGRDAACDPRVVNAFIAGNRGEIEDLLANHSGLRERIAWYIERFGDRCESELKLESITLRIDPMPLYRAIGRAAHAASTGNESTGRLEDRARELLDASLRGNPLRRLVFKWVLKHARNRIRDRENLRFARTRLFGRIRAIFRELGNRASRRGLLTACDDVFHLEVDEALAVLTTTDAASLVLLVERRRAQFEANLSFAAPANRVITENGRIVESSAIAVDGCDDAVRKGLGCCAGIVRGRVRVVEDPSQAFSHGEILVTARTDPSWVMLFPAASGIIVERGSLLSHAAIVSREMGIPSVVAVSGLMAWLRTGDVVEFNGATGVIRRIETA